MKRAWIKLASGALLAFSISEASPGGEKIPLKNWIPTVLTVPVPQKAMSVAPALMSEPRNQTDSMEITSEEDRQIRTQEAEAVEQAAGGLTFSYYYVSGATLMPRDSGTGRDYSGSGCSFTVGGTDRIMNTELNLPDGAMLKYLRIFYIDTNATEEVRGYITRYATGSTADDLISVSSSGSGGFGTALSAEICDPSPCPPPPAVGIGHVVDNFGYSYVLIAWPDISSSTVQVCGLRVAYYPPATGAFHPITPCRIADTRPGEGFAGQFGPPALVANTPRTFDLVAGSCGIPAEAIAVSLNVTATQTQGPGDIRLYPAPGSAPLVSTLNYLANQTVANAAVVRLGTSGVTFLPDVSGTHLVVDVNGFYY